MGAKKYKRVDKILIECLVIVMIVGIVMGGGAYLIGTSLLFIYSSDPQVISYGLLRMSLHLCSLFLMWNDGCICWIS